MARAASIMVTSFRTAFGSFVSPETMDTCTNPDNCYLYEKMGYRQTSRQTVINDKMTIVGYEKD